MVEILSIDEYADALILVFDDCHMGSITKSRRDGGMLLLFDQFECFLVLCRVTFLEHFEVSSSICNHLDETAARVIVFLVLLQMRCEEINLFGEHCYLHLLAPGVFAVHLVLFDDCLLFLR